MSWVTCCAPCRSIISQVHNYIYQTTKYLSEVHLGSGSIPLPQGVDVASHVPSIAYKIPDLEAFAQVTLIDTSTQQVKACVQSTLSNGWSTRQPAVSWATGGLAFLALIACLWYSSAEGSTSLAPQRFIDLMFLYQHIGSTGLLNLNYPVVFTSYTLNFSWALGLFAGSTAIQNAIDSMRRRTGGNGQAAVGVIETVNRKFSPYNDVVVPSPLTRRFVSPPVEIETSGNSLSAGIPTYTNSLGIAATDAFMSVFFTAIILSAIVLVLSLFLLGGVALYARITGKATSPHLKFWARANFLRLVRGYVPPVCENSYFCRVSSPLAPSSSSHFTSGHCTTHGSASFSASSSASSWASLSL